MSSVIVYKREPTSSTAHVQLREMELMAEGQDRRRQRALDVVGQVDIDVVLGQGNARPRPADQPTRAFKW